MKKLPIPGPLSPVRKPKPLPYPRIGARTVELLKDLAGGVRPVGKSNLRLSSVVPESCVSDMASDSWLSKNVRPVTVLWLMIFNTIVLVGFFVGVSFPDQFLILLTLLDPVVFGFYFGSRGLEKVSFLRGRKDG